VLGGNGKRRSQSIVDEIHDETISPIDSDAMLVSDYVDRQVSGQAIRNESGDLSRFFEGMLQFGPVDLAGTQPQTIPSGGAPPESATEWPPDIVVPTPQVTIGR
jgi:hypothetical protein